MKTTLSLPRIALVVAAHVMPLAARAHEGHASYGEQHGHATDVGFVLVAVLAIAAVLWGRRK